MGESVGSVVFVHAVLVGVLEFVEVVAEDRFLVRCAVLFGELFEKGDRLTDFGVVLVGEVAANQRQRAGFFDIEFFSSALAFAVGVGLAQPPQGNPIGDNTFESKLSCGLQHGFGTDACDRFKGKKHEVQLGFDVVEVIFVGDVGDG